jgi:Domain of unknown function (DUF4376)
MMKFSQKTGTFYPEQIEYTNLPDDLIDVSLPDFDAAMARGPLDTLSVVNGKLVIVPAAKADLLAFNQGQTWQKIKQLRDSKQNGGVNVSGKWYQTDSSSRIKYLGLMQMSTIPDNLQWKTMDGSFSTMTKDIASSIFGAVSTLDMTLFSVAEAHKAAMLKAKDPTSYDFSANWPEFYQ